MKSKLAAAAIIFGTAIILRYVLPTGVAPPEPSVTQRLQLPAAASSVAKGRLERLPQAASSIATAAGHETAHQDGSTTGQVTLASGVDSRASRLPEVIHGSLHEPLEQLQEPSNAFPVVSGQQIFNNPFVNTGSRESAATVQVVSPARNADPTPGQPLSIENMVASLFPETETETERERETETLSVSEVEVEEAESEVESPYFPLSDGDDSTIWYAKSNKRSLATSPIEGAKKLEKDPERPSQPSSGSKAAPKNSPPRHMNRELDRRSPARAESPEPKPQRKSAKSAPPSPGLIRQMETISKDCPHCDGRGCMTCLGELFKNGESETPQPIDWQVCPRCQGGGCSHCRGYGMVLEADRIKGDSLHQPSSNVDNDPTCGISESTGSGDWFEPIEATNMVGEPKRLAGFGHLSSRLTERAGSGFFGGTVAGCDKCESDPCRCELGQRIRQLGPGRTEIQVDPCDTGKLWNSWDCAATWRPRHGMGSLESYLFRGRRAAGAGSCSDDGCDDTATCKSPFGGWLASGIYGNSDGRGGSTGNAPIAFNNLAEEPQLHQAWLFARREATTGGDLNFGYRTDVMFGTDGPNTQSFGDASWDEKWDTSREYGWALPQLYVEAAWQNMKLIVGHFYTIIGYEVVQAPNNFFYSHAYTFNYNEPFTHTGVLLKSEFTERLTFYSGWTAGWDTGFSNGNNGSTFLGAVGFAPTDDFSVIYATSFGDPGDDPVNASETYLQSIVADWNITDRLEYVFHSDFQTRSSATLGGNSYGVNNYLFYKLNECTKLGLRYEWFRDGRGANAIDNASEHFHELTLGVNRNLSDRLVVRPEVRYDWTDRDDAFLGGGPGPFANGTKRSQLSLGVSGYFTF